MTEKEWLECEDCRGMLFFMRAWISNRKCHLFSCGSIRCIWESIDGELRIVREAVEIGERLAEGVECQQELDYYLRILRDHPPCIARFGLDHLDFATCLVSGEPLAAAADTLYFCFGRNSRWNIAAQCELLREVFGNPFRPVSINPIWNTPTVTNLAQAAYEVRIMPSGELDPARLAVLSDALEEAGCDNDDILNHLRTPGSHVRGCWALDLVLGKE